VPAIGDLDGIGRAQARFLEEERAEVYEQERREQDLRRLTRRAEKLGYTLTQGAPPSAAAAD
jgi:NADP-dependent 3-hydroxy acid dehydrogenase YdfG